MTATVETPQLIDAIGTRLRLRALCAMGHSQTRIARALGEPIWVINRIMGGVTRVVSPQLRADAGALVRLWWAPRPRSHGRRAEGCCGSQVTRGTLMVHGRRS